MPSANKKAICDYETYCFVIRRCLEEELHLPPAQVDALFRRREKDVRAMYENRVPPSSAIVELADAL